IAFAERTDDGILRQASFLGLREDIGSKSVVDERAQKPPPAKSRQEGNAVHGIKISHPERQIWPSLQITKLDLARYYDGVGELIVPHLARRPLTLVRCPDG